MSAKKKNKIFEKIVKTSEINVHISEKIIKPLKRIKSSEKIKKLYYHRADDVPNLVYHILLSVRIFLMHMHLCICM